MKKIDRFREDGSVVLIRVINYCTAKKYQDDNFVLHVIVFRYMILAKDNISCHIAKQTSFGVGPDPLNFLMSTLLNTFGNW